VKTLLLFVHILCFILFLSLVNILLKRFPRARIKTITSALYIFNKITRLLLGIKIKITGKKWALKKRGVFFVCNHLSYLDGIITSSLSPLVFIGKSELRQWPILGIMVFLSGTIFVNRINPANIQKELKKITRILKNGVNVILFPEGTSSDGKDLLPFKSSFFAAPIETGCYVVPLAIRYKKINSQNITNKNKDYVYWYGDMELVPHLFNLLGLKSIEVEIKVCNPVYVPENYRKENTSFHRKRISQVSKKIIENSLAENGVRP